MDYSFCKLTRILLIIFISVLECRRHTVDIIPEQSLTLLPLLERQLCLVTGCPCIAQISLQPWPDWSVWAVCCTRPAVGLGDCSHKPEASQPPAQGSDSHLQNHLRTALRFSHWTFRYADTEPLGVSFSWKKHFCFRLENWRCSWKNNDRNTLKVMAWIQIS